MDNSISGNKSTINYKTRLEELEKKLSDKRKSLTSNLEFAKEIFNQLMNGDTTTDDSSEGGGSGAVS